MRCGSRPGSRWVEFRVHFALVQNSMMHLTQGGVQPRVLQVKGCMVKGLELGFCSDAGACADCAPCSVERCDPINQTWLLNNKNERGSKSKS